MAVKSSLKNMVICLGTITLVCSLLLSGVFVITEEPIAKAAKARENAAIAAVSPDFDKVVSLVSSKGTQYSRTLSAAGDTLCYVINGTSTGFGGRLSLMVGILPDGTVYRTSVLEHSETPGLGAKCVEESFSGQFEGFNPSGKKLAVTKDGGNIDALTAATITSRAYCTALENALTAFEKIRSEEGGQTNE